MDVWKGGGGGLGKCPLGLKKKTEIEEKEDIPRIIIVIIIIKTL
jgi:hypothetical protein